MGRLKDLRKQTLPLYLTDMVLMDKLPLCVCGGRLFSSQAVQIDLCKPWRYRDERVSLSISTSCMVRQVYRLFYTVEPAFAWISLNTYYTEINKLLTYNVTILPLNHVYYKIYRFMTMLYWYNYHISGHYQSSCLLFKNTTFQRLDSVSVFSWSPETETSSFYLDHLS
jgi:hypothetical protein